MSWLQTRNLQFIALREIPRLSPDKFLTQLAEAAGEGARVVQYFGLRNADRSVSVYAILAQDDRSRLLVAVSDFAPEQSYPSLTPLIPSIHLFERELFEQTGIHPAGHPWLKPVRQPADHAYPFFSIEGEQLHEFGVGPVHAGIIEPGHFRFTCRGESIVHLEIALGYQHRGVEQLFERNNATPHHLLRLAESIAGDSVIGHAGCYVRALETLASCAVSRNARLVRTIALELERIAAHLGDLSALASDVAYITGSAVFGALRTRVINTTMALCGSRFGRDWLVPGGVRGFGASTEILANLRPTVEAALMEVEERAELAAAVMFASPSLLARFEKTGEVSAPTARSIGMVGPAARASGVSVDVRTDHPFGGYALFPVHTLTMESGDVYARAYLRFVEITQSLGIIREQLSEARTADLLIPPGPPAPDAMVVSMGEGWRGEIVHTAITDRSGRFRRYKITDPSFHNWLALALSVRENGISDFPLCNKSFNLSYCGFDL